VAAGAASALITGLYLMLTDWPSSGADDGPSDARATPVTSATPTPTTTTTTTTLGVQSAQGWQRATQTELRRGDTVTVRYSTGAWTVDSTRLPGVGPLGHSAADDESLRFARDCKVDATAPFGTLLGRFSGNPKSLPSHRVKREWRFRASRAGTLELRINDGDGCLDDNKGALTVSVLVTR